MKGVEFTFKDGSKDNYDPIDPDEVVETDYDYTLFVGANDYNILKSEITNIRYYDTCEHCGYELPGYCRCEELNLNQP